MKHSGAVEIKKKKKKKELTRLWFQQFSLRFVNGMVKSIVAEKWFRFLDT